MTIKRIYEINGNNQVVINLPDDFKHSKRVLVTVEDSMDTKATKIELLKQASIDPIFLSDIMEINEDFSQIDSEVI